VICWIPYVGAGLGVLALALGAVAWPKATRQQSGLAMPITGVILGGLSLIFGVILTVAIMSSI